MKSTALLLTAVFAVGAMAAPAAVQAQHHESHVDRLGRVLFPTSCSAPAQQQFERGLALLHSFSFLEADKAFRAAAETDTGCGIAYWGLATTQRNNPLIPPFPAPLLKRGWEAAEKGLEVGARTQRERDWIAAIAVFYKDYETVDQDTRTAGYMGAMAALAEKYPDDVEAKVFYALALDEAAPLDDRSYANQLKAVAILTPIDRKYPDHPGVAHYLIHSLDYTPLATRGLPAANKYAGIA
ncbi:MAG: hypothetical protein JO021_24050, partial [Alphaproteobacteria bacterium]|nr:hypothetical protein [Alphaproteobacteria bacterium]